jgi:hypothetical protein
MKRVINFLIIVVFILASAPLFAQKPTEDRMKRDIAVMETALSEMIKQEFDQRNFLFMDVKGSYVSGYGVTFTVPTSMITGTWSTGGNEVVIVDGRVSGSVFASPTPDSELAITEREAHEAKEAMQSTNKNKNVQKERDKAEREAQIARTNADRAAQEAREAEREAREVTVYGLQSTNGVNAYTYSSSRNRKRINSDSLNAVNNAKIIEAAKTFIADYGDMLSQLASNERIVVTNKGTNDNYFWNNGQKQKRSLLSVEAAKSDLTQFRQGSITRDQLLKKMKVVNTVTSEEREPDMELLASIFNRLYREDLSRTYYVQGGTYYERLTDFGVILHMQVVSSLSNGDYYTPAKDVRLAMPTLGLTNLTQEERDKKVKELYPVFESELKENILDYGRTLKSLNDNEQLIVDVSMTKCTGCGIPASLEVAVKASVLKDFNAGKLDRSAALSKIEVKKGPSQ